MPVEIDGGMRWRTPATAPYMAHSRLILYCTLEGKEPGTPCVISADLADPDFLILIADFLKATRVVLH